MIKEYWDTCIFISYLNDKPEEKNKVDIIEAFIRHAEKPTSNILIVVSTIVLCELQPRDTYNQLHYQELRELFYTARHFIKVQGLTPKIADEVSKLRTIHGNSLDLADAVHMVTASLEDCNVLYTFNGDAARRRPKDILSFNGVSVIEGKPPLNIKIPQMPLDSQLPLS